MRRSSLIIAITCWAVAASATVIDQPILETQTWTAQGSPYDVMTSVTVAGGHTLTIEPGVVVRFVQGAFCLLDPGASLVAEGTEQERILFTVQSGGTEYGPLMLSVAGGDSRIRDCIFEHAMVVMADAPLALERVVVRQCSEGLQFGEGDFGTISDLTVMDCDIGITIQESAEVDLVDCIVFGNDYGGVLDLQGLYGSTSSIRGSLIRANTGTGVQGVARIIDCVIDDNLGDGIAWGLEAPFFWPSEVRGCTITNNRDCGIRVMGFVGESPAIITGCAFGGNGAHALDITLSHHYDTIDARWNDWGVYTEAEVEAQINMAGEGLATLLYLPFSGVVATEAWTLSAVKELFR